MAEYYATEERAMAPGIAGEWPEVIPKPDNPNGRLSKIPDAQKTADRAIADLEALAKRTDIPTDAVLLIRETRLRLISIFG